MSVFKREGVYRYRFQIRGERYFKALPWCKTVDEARKAEDAHRARVWAGADEEPEESQNFKEFVEQTYLPWVKLNKSSTTYKNYKWRCKDLIKVFGKLELADISTSKVEKFKEKEVQRRTRQKRTQGAASVNTYLAILGGIFTRAEELKLIKRGARPDIDALRADSRRLRYLTVAEERALRDAAKQTRAPYLADMIAIGCATGLRREELFSLRKADVDLSLNVLSVIGKGNKLRSVPLAPDGEARAILARLVKDSKSEYVFTSPHSGSRFKEVTYALRAACGIAKLPGITLHVCRHTFCTRLAAIGVDVRTIQTLAGHSKIQTTMKYVHQVESNKHAAIAKLSAVFDGAQVAQTEAPCPKEQRDKALEMSLKNSPFYRDG